MNNRTNCAYSPTKTGGVPTRTAVVDVEVGASPPTMDSRRGRRTLWPERLNVGRANAGVWIRVTEPLSRSTASQLASDLRNSHTRNPRTMRVRGVLPCERWETVWGPLDDAAEPTEFFIWFRLVASDE
jgi:hypothetical protein